MIITFDNNDRRNRPDRPAKANEWGKRYQFWSCADVDIMPPNNFAQVLSSGSSTGSFIFQIIDINLGPNYQFFCSSFSPSLSPRRAVVMAEPSAEDVAATETTTETFVNTR